MAKNKVKKEPTTAITNTVLDETPPPQELYTGNVYEFYGGISISNNTGPVTVTVNLQGIPNNPPPKPGTGNP